MKDTPLRHDRASGMQIARCAGCDLIGRFRLAVGEDGAEWHAIDIDGSTYLCGRVSFYSARGGRHTPQVRSAVWRPPAWEQVADDRRAARLREEGER